MEYWDRRYNFLPKFLKHPAIKSMVSESYSIEPKKPIPNAIIPIEGYRDAVAQKVKDEWASEYDRQSLEIINNLNNNEMKKEQVPSIGRIVEYFPGNISLPNGMKSAPAIITQCWAPDAPVNLTVFLMDPNGKENVRTAWSVPHVSNELRNPDHPYWDWPTIVTRDEDVKVMGSKGL